jgi:hypothetical protein
MTKTAKGLTANAAASSTTHARLNMTPPNAQLAPPYLIALRRQDNRLGQRQFGFSCPPGAHMIDSEEENDER